MAPADGQPGGGMAGAGVGNSGSVSRTKARTRATAPIEVSIMVQFLMREASPVEKVMTMFKATPTEPGVYIPGTKRNPSHSRSTPLVVPAHELLARAS